MPEGPEIYLAAKFINAVSKSVLYGGKIVKSEVSLKNPDVDWNEDIYHVRAESRGKELMVKLYAGENEEKGQKSMNIVFRFGMSGCFKFTGVDQLPKHAHLRFFTRNKDDPKVLSFVDYRRFGRWEVNSTWSPDRGPDPMWEYPAFRDKVLNNLQDATFNKPICEALLNQKFFNGIGNYLRAEILYRYGARPFECARYLLSEIKPISKWYDSHMITKKKEVKCVKPDLLDLCHILPKEVISLGGGKGYDVDVKPEDDSYKEFRSWLQCYYKDGMKNLVDHNKRTIWFIGDPGPLVPKEQNSRKKIVRKSKREQSDEKSFDVEKKTKERKRGKKQGSINSDQNTNVKMTRKRKVTVDGSALNKTEKSRKLTAKNVVKKEKLKEKSETEEEEGEYKNKTRKGRKRGVKKGSIDCDQNKTVRMTRRRK